MEEDTRSRYSMHALLSRGPGHIDQRTYQLENLKRCPALKAFQEIKSPRKQEEKIEEISYKSDLDDEPRL